MQGDVKNLETKMADAFGNDGLRRKRDKDAVESKMIQGFKDEEHERRTVRDELKILMDDIKKQ